MGDASKWAVRSVTPRRKIEVPEMTTEHRVATAILCAKEMWKDLEWNEWADEWLSGENRTADAARSATADAAYAAAYANVDIIAKIEEAKKYLGG